MSFETSPDSTVSRSANPEIANQTPCSHPAPQHWSPHAKAWFAALLGWSTLMCTFGLSGGAAFEPVDCWVAQTAREMFDANEWLMPRFCGEHRVQKSPGAYWAVMLVAMAHGSVDEIAVRMPNAIAGVLLVAIIFWLAHRIAGERVAIFSGFAAASSVLVLYWSHRGASELGLTMFCTLAVACLWVGCECEQPGRRRTLFWMAGYVAAGLAMLYKMPMPLACVGIPAIGYVLLQRRWRVLASGWHLVGLLLFALPWLPWVIYVLKVEPDALAKWRVEFVDRFSGDLPTVTSQDQPIFYLYYLIPLMLFTAPYCLSLPASIFRGIKVAFGRDSNESDNTAHSATRPFYRTGIAFCLIWFFSLFAFFTAATGKESRYALPMLPPLFILLGMELSRLFDSRRTIPAGLQRAALIAVTIFIPAGLVGGYFGVQTWHSREPLYDWSDIWPSFIAAAVALGFFGLLSAYLFARGRRNHAFAALVATMFVAWPIGWSQLAPKLKSQLPYVVFGHQLRDQIDPIYRPVMYQIAQQDPRVVWHGDVRIPRVVNQLDLLAMQGGRRNVDTEREIIGEAIIRHLREDKVALFVASRYDYRVFMHYAPEHLAGKGETMPPTFLWLQTPIGSNKRQNVVFGNVPPPWPEPKLRENTKDDDTVTKADPN